MTLLGLIVIVGIVVGYMYLLTRAIYGKYTYDRYQYIIGGYWTYKGGLKPIHFIKTIGWHIAIIASAIAIIWLVSVVNSVRIS